MICILSKGDRIGGNTTTADRIAYVLFGDAALTSRALLSGYACRHVPTLNFASSQDLRLWAVQNGVSLLLGVHALHSGSLLAGTRLPFVLIFGGTDLHEFSRNPQQLQQMTAAVVEARCCKQLSRKPCFITVMLAV